MFLKRYQGLLSSPQYHILLNTIANHALDNRFASEDDIADLVAILKGDDVELLIAKNIQCLEHKTTKNYLIPLSRLFAGVNDAFTQDLLHNSLLKANTIVELHIKESSLSLKRELALHISAKLQAMELSYDALKQIHKALFIDVYQFSGLDRHDMGIMGQFGRGKKYFCLGALLPQHSKILFGILDNQQAFRGLSYEQFLDSLCNLWIDLEELQPFREGNGRVIRLLIAEIARRCGYRLCFDGLVGLLQPALDAAFADECIVLRDLIANNLQSSAP